VASNLLHQERPFKPFAYRNLGVMATIGRNKAVAEIWRLKFGGIAAWLLWRWFTSALSWV
jgi:NADH dehydrogenase